MKAVRGKAKMLDFLAGRGFPVPPLCYFSLAEWRDTPENCLSKARALGAGLLAVRSSSMSEDGLESSMAGAFESILNVPAEGRALPEAVNKVAQSLDAPEDQILLQKMVEKVVMSGVLMTRSIDDGAPYYVLNYDDVSGRTDTVTGGRGVSKTVYIHRGVHENDFDSPRLAAVIALARRLEGFFGDMPLDMEFAVDEALCVHLLQARPICSAEHWADDVEEKVNRHIGHVADFARQITGPRLGLYGGRAILGVMPDWNPAEMIGIHPRPLALSLYRDLITRQSWRLAREMMGYRALPPVELMLSVAGRPYIDVRASFNSFLPAALPDEIAEKLVSAWLNRLDDHPAFHDKVEFEIVQTVLEPGFEEIFRARYGDLLTDAELVEYRVRLTDLTALALSPASSLDTAMGNIEKLRAIGESTLEEERRAAEAFSQFDLALRLAGALDQCRTLGTVPFAVAARHGFIAESFLRGAVRLGVLEKERVEALKRSIKTVSGELTRDFHETLAGRKPAADFMRRYGHLRPGAYDITSPSYRERSDLFDIEAPADAFAENTENAENAEAPFTLTEPEKAVLGKMLAGCRLKTAPEAFVKYVRRAVAAREYAKFIFTRHLDHILYLAELWGRRIGFSREEMSFLPIDDVISATFQPLPLEGREYFRERLESYRRDYALGRSFRLSYLIRSARDVYIVPQHRSEPNFIGSGEVTARAVHLAGGGSAPDLAGAIVCIESADPGYDWIFTRNIAGLVTRYGGANSHMAIRCAEYGLPAAIGCGELIFENAAKSEFLRLSCAARSLSPEGPLFRRGEANP